MSDSKKIPFESYVVSIILLLAGGILYGLHVYFNIFAPLCFISTSFWLLLILQNKSRAGLIYFFFMVYTMNLIGTFWLKDFNLQSWLIAPILYSLFYIPLYFTVRIIHGNWPKMPLSLIWATAFTGMEWFRVQVSPGRLPLCQLSDAFINYTKIIQIVDVLGTGVLTFMACMTSGLLADFILNYSGENRLKKRSLLTQVAIIFTIYCLCTIYGIYRDSEKTFSYGPKIGIIDPVFGKWVSNQPDTSRLPKLENLTKKLLHEKVDLIVWPENSLTFPYNDKSSNEFSSPTINRISKLSLELSTPILVDGPTWDANGTIMRHTTSLISIRRPLQKYNKIVLIPWSEYVPFHETLSTFSSNAGANYLKFISKFYETPAIFKAGLLTDVKQMTILSNNRVWYFGTPICFEIGSPGLIRQWSSLSHSARNQGVDFIINPTNEVLLGYGVHRQTLITARFRAIENRLSIVKASNGGFSAIIDPNGHIKHSIERKVGDIGTFGEASALVVNIIIDKRRPTIYTKIGDVFPILCFLAVVMGTIFTVISRMIFKKN